MKRVTNTHRLWLWNVQTAIDKHVPFDYVNITPKRVDILYDLELIEYVKQGRGPYQLSETGKAEIEKFKAYAEKVKLKKKAKGLIPEPPKETKE